MTSTMHSTHDMTSTTYDYYSHATDDLACRQTFGFVSFYFMDTSMYGLMGM